MLTTPETTAPSHRCADSHHRRHTIGSGLASDPIYIFEDNAISLVDSFSYPDNPGNAVSIERQDIATGDEALELGRVHLRHRLIARPGLPEPPISQTEQEESQNSSIRSSSAFHCWALSRAAAKTTAPTRAPVPT